MTNNHTPSPAPLAPPTPLAQGKRPTVAVVAGSGGIKTFAAIALYEFLDEAKITPDLLIGCSGGAIMTGMRAMGYSPARMLEMIPQMLSRDLFSKVDYRALLGIPRLPFGRFDFSCGILKPEKLRAIHRQVFGDARLEELRPATLFSSLDKLPPHRRVDEGSSNIERGFPRNKSLQHSR